LPPAKIRRKNGTVAAATLKNALRIVPRLNVMAL
jgi:hypothetical protein